MKKIHFIAAIFLANAVFSQEAITAAGGDFSGSGGNIAYSVGQVHYTTNFSTSGSSSQGVQQTYQISTNDLAEYEGSNLFSVFPNPTSDFLILQVDNNFKSLNFELSDINGKIIFKEIIKSLTTPISLINQPSATYFLKVIDGSNRIQSFKIIKN